MKLYKNEKENNKKEEKEVEIPRHFAVLSEVILASVVALSWMEKSRNSFGGRRQKSIVQFLSVDVFLISSACAICSFMSETEIMFFSFFWKIL